MAFPKVFLIQYAVHFIYEYKVVDIPKVDDRCQWKAVMEIKLPFVGLITYFIPNFL